MSTSVTAIFLDSSSLRSITPRGTEARVLQDLVNADAIEIHVSTIVEQEVATGLAEDTKVKVHSGWATDREHAKLKAAVDLANGAGPLILQGVKQWLDRLGTIRHAPTGDETARVFEAYFAGNAPFKAKKNRIDLPDAFVVESLRSFASSAPGKVYFVAKDTKLSEAAARVPKVEVGDDLLKILITIDIARPVTLDELIDYCRDHTPDLESGIAKQLGEAILDYEFTEPTLPSDNGDATVSAYGEVADISLKMGDADVVGEDVLVVPFHCTADDCLVDFYIFKSDYYGLHEDIEKHISIADSDWNSHYMWAQAQVSLAVEARLLVAVTAVHEPAIGKRELALGKMDIEVDAVNIVEPKIFTAGRRPRRKKMPPPGR